MNIQPRHLAAGLYQDCQAADDAKSAATCVARQVILSIDKRAVPPGASTADSSSPAKSWRGLVAGEQKHVRVGDCAAGGRVTIEIEMGFERASMDLVAERAATSKRSCACRKASSTSCDQAIFVDQASDVSVFPDAVQVEVGEFR